MNKLFTKIAALALGGVMAIGVGVAVASGNKAFPAKASDGNATVAFSEGTFDSANSITWAAEDGSTKIATVQQLKSDGTNCNSSYVSAPRVYRANILSFVAEEGYVINSVSIAYSGNYSGASWTCGDSLNNGAIAGTSNVNGPTGSLSSPLVFSAVSNDGVSAIYAKNSTSSGTNTQLRPTSITIEYTSTSGGGTCEHDWGSGTQTTAPTCETAGVMTYTCSKCNEQKTEPIDALGHDYGDWVIDTPATCTEAGSKHRTCSRNSNHVENETIPAVGHTYVNHICSVCGAEEPLEVTFAYSGSTTNMTGNNDAATLGQSATDWSVVANKGGNNNYPGLNKDGEIRTYGSNQNYIVFKTLAATGTRFLTEVTISSNTKYFGLYEGEADFTTAISPTGNNPYVYTLSEGVTAFTIRNEGSTSKIQSVVVTYTDVVAETYTVSFNGNGALGSMNDVEDVLGSYTLPANGFTVPSGTRFGGWKAANSGDPIAAGDSYEVSEDVTFWAQWINVSTISFNSNGGSGSMSNETVDTGESYTLPANGFTVPSGKQFAGWKVGNTGETLAANSSYTLTGNITLYAQWEDKQALGGLTDGGYYFLIIDDHVLKASSFDNKGADTYTTANATTEGLTKSDAWYFKSTGTDDQWFIRSSSANDASYLGVTPSKSSDNNGVSSTSTSDSWNVTTDEDDKLYLEDVNYERHLSYTTSSGSYIRAYLSSSTVEASPVRFVEFQDLTLTITGKNSEYTDTSVTLSSNAGAGTSWEITTNPDSIGSLTTASGASTSLSVSGAGTVVVTASADGYVSATHTVTFTVRPSYFIELSGECTNGTSSLGINGKTFMVTVDNSNLAGNIDWEVTSGTVSGITSDNEGFMATFASTGTVTISATDLGHTDNTQSISFTVIESLNEIYAKNDSVSSIRFTSTGKTGASAEADDGTTWSINSDANEQNGDATSGIHYGSNNSTSGYVTYIEMTTSDITDVVTSVKVNARAVNSDAHLTVTVGGAAFKCSGETSVDPDNTSRDYEFTGSGSGTITISLAKESSAIKALYIGGVVVKSTSAVASPIANTNATVQQEVLTFVATMNTDLSVCSGSSTLSTSVWSTLAGKFETAAGNSSDEALFRRMFKYADATPRAGDGSATTGDTLQNALARYNYVLEKYGTTNYADFLHRAEANKVIPKASLSNSVLGLIAGTTSNSIAIIVIISMISVTAIGGYFFLRKRKEN